MDQKFERVRDRNGDPIAGFFVRTYPTKNGRVNRRYYGIFTDWKGIRRRFPLGNEQKPALATLADKIRKNNAEHDFDEAKTRNVTFSQWAAQCKNAMNERDSSSLAHLEKKFGSMLLTRISDNDVLDFRATRAQENIIRHNKPAKGLVSSTTINKELGLLRKLLRLAQSKGLINRLPKFKMEAEPSRERVLSAEEFQTLRDKAEPWLQRVCVAAYETALTRGDLLGLTWDEVDRKNWVIQLSGGREKTKVRQEIPIRTEALTALFKELDAARKKLPNVEGLVFTKDGQRIKPMGLRRALQRACKEAKIQNFTFHDFRHCAVTNWHSMNVPPSVAMRMAGHSSVQSHKKYVNMGTQQVIEAFENSLRQRELGETLKKEREQKAV